MTVKKVGGGGEVNIIRRKWGFNTIPILSSIIENSWRGRRTNKGKRKGEVFNKPAGGNQQKRTPDEPKKKSIKADPFREFLKSNAVRGVFSA